MPEYLLKIRRYDPKSGEAAYWDEHRVELGARNSVLDAILKIRDEVDGSVGIRCSCQQAICGSCGVRMNGKPGLACNTHLEEAAARMHGAGWNDRPRRRGQPVCRGGRGRGGTTPAGVIEVEPMGNMPVIRDLIVDMDAVHWKKIQRVTPYLINKQPVPEREYIVPHENMVDITQSMACIQCGACVSDCLSMEIDPLFVGPAALAKAYRFVGDPRDAEHAERLKDLSEDEHGIYDCTHCFNCIDACPKEVAPMSQIMRLRRRAGSRRRDRRPQQRPPARGRLRHAGARLRPAERGRAAAAQLRRQLVVRQVPSRRGPGAAQVVAGDRPGVLRGKINLKTAMFGHKLAKAGPGRAQADLQRRSTTARTASS